MNLETLIDHNLPRNLENGECEDTSESDSAVRLEKTHKTMKIKKETRRFKDLLEPLIDLSQPNVTTIMQRPVDMGETKRYRRKN